MRIPLLYLLIVLLVVACSKVKLSEPQGEIKPFVVPSHFPAPHYSFENNPITPEGVALGRKLFYDKMLSVDQTISCQSCHFQHAAFSDSGKKVSAGVEGRLGRRNSPPLFNLAWNTSFMWDGGINHLEVMPIAPITDHVEMDLPLSELLERLNASSDYVLAFQQAFKQQEITDQLVLFALAQFMSTLISASSNYDLALKNEYTYTQEELKGKTLFEANCVTCHAPPLFTDFSFKNNGSFMHENEKGRYEITLDTNDIGKFKVPSLRNIALTNPYMHNGEYADLMTVINHYSEGISNATRLADELPKEGFHFSTEEKEALLAFLLTLTDYNFTNDPKLSKP